MNVMKATLLKEIEELERKEKRRLKRISGGWNIT